MLDELTVAGEVLWAGHGSLARNDGWVSLMPAIAAPELLPPAVEGEFSQLHKAILHTLDDDQALFARTIVDRLGTASDAAEWTDPEVGAAIWDLVWAGALTNDTMAPVRARLGVGATAHRTRAATPRARFSRYSRSALTAGAVGSAGPGSAAGHAGTRPAIALDLAGRWSQLPPRSSDETRKAVVRVEVLLDRYGILFRGEVSAEGVPGGFSAVYPVLRQAEETGRYRRGYFVEGLGGAQFGVAGAVDRLRGVSAAADAETRPADGALVLAATDPANPYGAALSWPERVQQPAAEDSKRGHQPARKAGALVVLVDGRCVLYVERGGRTLLSFTDDAALLGRAAEALSSTVRHGDLGKLHVETADGGRVASSSLGQALERAGFRPSPRGLQLRG
jgi:ATP-dependent Lhr-like helicase